MSERRPIVFDYVRRTGPRQPCLHGTRVCIVCHQEKPITEFWRSQRDGHDRRCAVCARHDAKLKRQRTERIPKHPCIGYPGFVCDRLVRYHHRCGRCQVAHQRMVEDEAMRKRLPSGPKLCGKPRWGGACREVLLFQVNREGKLVTWCPIHAEDVPAVIRPGAVNYPPSPEAA